MRVEKSPQHFSMSFCLSVLFHAVCLIALLLLLKYDSSLVNLEKVSKNAWVQVEVMPEKKNDQEVPKDKKRVVQTEKGQKVEVAQADANLGAENQQVDRQTVSKSRSSRMGTSKNARQIEKFPTKNLSDFGLKLFTATKTRPEESNWATPGTRPEDYILGMQESDRTALNTKEFKFFGYFQRIRARLDRAWVPVLREKLATYYRSGRQLASDMDHLTKVLVVLNGQGEIVRVVVLGESGTQELDSAAVAAFNKAGPFPNPPKGIVDQDSEVKIPWDFVLKT